MPYKSEYLHKKIPKELDRRVKLSAEDKVKIKRLYGKVSQRKLARMFGVSRRLIVFIGCPEKYEKNKLLRELRGGSAIYYNKNKQRVAMKNTRSYRKVLDNKNLLGDVK